jgi:hypothetical protein|tara:strand:- start:9843 stop:9956 length:114 start_codon:yes stop_codon:yes gene_type:complete
MAGRDGGDLREENAQRGGETESAQQPLSFLMIFVIIY